MPPALLRLETHNKSGREMTPNVLREKEEKAVLNTGHNTAHNAAHNTVLKCRWPVFFVCKTRAPDS
jgi:hypothetical protein